MELVFVLIIVLAGKQNVSAERFACIGDAVQSWRDAGCPASSQPDMAYVAEELYPGYFERVSVPLGMTIN